MTSLTIGTSTLMSLLTRKETKKMTKNFIVARPRVFYSTHYDSLTIGAYYLDIEFNYCYKTEDLPVIKAFVFSSIKYSLCRPFFSCYFFGGVKM